MKVKANPAKFAWIRFCLLAFGLLFLTLAVSAEFSVKEWSRWREILILDNSAPPGHVLVELDGKVFASAQSDLRDLRVVDQTGGEVPSKTIIQREESDIETISVEMLDRALDANGNSSFTLDLGDNPQRHNLIELESESRNFSRQVKIETSDDNRRWTVVRSDGYIFDFSRDTTAQFLEVSYPISTKRYVRVTIVNGREQPIEISDASVQFSAEQEEVLTSWPVSIKSHAIDQKLKATVFDLDLGYAKVPTSRIELQTAAKNFHRHIEIEGSHQTGDEQGTGRQYWASVGSGEIYSVSLNHANRQHLQIDFPESRYRFLRVKIFHYDDQPLEFTGFKVSGHPRRLLFQRQAGKSYRLFYGNAEAAAPRYDLEQLSSYLELSKLPVIGLGEEHNQVPEIQTRQPWLDKQPMWLWATLTTAALLLGWMIFRLAKMTGS
ncbi:MAG: DUF3999 family protein [Blastocatellales bacterium]